ncbi:MAG: hypothetical protein M3R27_14040 [Bacteroidota bacterium]|nr:hypothetical protein [Bacteroidota bacterium]
MKTKQFFFLSALSVLISFTSCKKDNPEPEPENPAVVSGYDNGVFIVNEGPFGAGTGTLSFYSRSSGSVSNDIFEAKNGYPLGNIAQSMEIYNGKGYVVVNNAGKVEVVDASSLASNGVVTGLTLPRFFIGIDANKGYVSEWGAGGTTGAIKIIDLNTKSITGTISTGKGAEGMVKSGTSVYVACGGGFDNDSVVTVINSATNAVITTINVGANPKTIRMDAAGKIWVLCSGEWDASFTVLVKPGKLVRIDPSTNMVDLSLPFSSTFSQPNSLVTNAAKTMLFYSYNSAVYSHSISASSLSASSLINRSFYALGVDPANDQFFGSDAVDFSSNGKVIRYSSSAVLLDSFNVGVIPGNFCFK